MISEVLAGFVQVAKPITWVLVHFVWQATLIAAALGIVLRTLRGGSPEIRYRCACWALLIVVTLPLVTLWQVIGTGPADINQITETLATEAVSDVQPVNPWIGPPTTTIGFDIERVFGIARWTLFIVWLCGSFFLSWYHLMGWRRMRMLSTRSVTPAPYTWQSRADAIAQQLGFERAIRILQSALVEVPTVIGFFRPVVVLPLSTLTGLDPRQIEVILAHELAHVWRCDALVNILQVLAETVFFYHPAVWWISRQIRQERELCCDEAAVSVAGDRLTLARALLQLEELRRPAPRLALTAAGGSLRNRINRLLGGETMSRQNVSNPVFGAALALSILAVVGISWAAVAKDFAPGDGMPVGIAGATLAGDYSADESVFSEGSAVGQVRGSWEPRSHGSRTTLQLSVNSGHGKSNIGLELKGDETALVSKAIGGFEIHREAGNFQFTGSLSAGGGSFVFLPDAAFFSALEGYGIIGLDAEERFVIAAVGVDRQWVAELDELGYGDQLDGDTMIALGIHRVTPDYVRELASAGVENVELDEVLAMKIHGLNAEWIEQMNSLGFDFGADELLAWKIHGVNSEYVESLSAAGWNDLAADEILAMKIHGISPEWVEEMRAAGLLDDVGADEALAIKIHGVTPAFLDELDSLGYHDVSADEMVAMKIHGVNKNFIEEVEYLGYRGVDVDELIAMRIHGVDSDFIKEQQQEYGQDVSIDDLLEHKILGHTRHR